MIGSNLSGNSKSHSKISDWDPMKRACRRFKHTYVVYALLEHVFRSCLDNFKECHLVLFLDESVRKHAVHLVDPEANELASLLFGLANAQKEKI